MNNLNFIDIKKNKKVTKLYNEAFPKDERIPIWLLKILARKNKAKFYGIYDNEKFVGLVYNIFYKDIVFVFYLAIDKATRGQGYGTKVLDSIKEKYKNYRIILCIEPVDENSDNYEQRVKRKNFYLKNGFKDSNYTIKEKNIIYEMLYYNENVILQEFQELMKNYFGKILHKCFYK
ncbi:MAG: GNAT family N-acetyltransferase [Clostridia bacterium]